MDDKNKGRETESLVAAFSNNFSTFKQWAIYAQLEIETPEQQHKHKPGEQKKDISSLAEKLADNFITFRGWADYVHPHTFKNN